MPSSEQWKTSTQSRSACRMVCSSLVSENKGLVALFSFFPQCLFIWALLHLSCSSGCLLQQCGLVSCSICVGSNSPFRDRTQAPCIGRVKSYPLDHQGTPLATLFFPSCQARENLGPLSLKQCNRFPWWYNRLESACQCRGHKFNPWPRENPHTRDKLSPCTAAAEPVLQTWGVAATEPQLEKACTQQPRPSATKNNYILIIFNN